MPDPSTDRIIILAASGVSIRQAEATIGRRMTDAERTAWDRAQVKRKLEIAAKKTRGPVSGSDRKHNSTSQHSRVKWVECADPARRKRLEASPVKWLKYYCHQAFSRPFDKPHTAIIDGAMTASETGGRFAVAAERGIGKSTILWAIILMLALAGIQPFPVCVPWASSALKRAFRFWRAQLCFNDRLGEDYPEICAPFRHAKGSSQKLAHTTWDGGPNDGGPTGATMAIGEGLIVLPDNRGCIGGATINGNPRGLNHPTASGKVLRPTIALLDDVQDRGTAKSAVQVNDTIEIIDGDVAGMGEAGASLPMLMSGNCIATDDVMAHYLASDQWKSLRIPCVESWPKGWDDGDGEAAKLWQEWFDLYRDGKGAPAFYKKNRKAMTAEMELSAPGTFKKATGVTDAFCAVMIRYFKMGKEAFHAECQQKPLKQGVTIYNLRPKAILSRVEKREPGQVPDWTKAVLCATDVNPSYALTTAIAAFGDDQRSAVLWYGTHPIGCDKTMSDAQIKATVHAALSEHGRRLSGLSCRPQHWTVDGGGSPQNTAIDFCANAIQICGIPAIASFGRASTQYRPTGGKGRKVIIREESQVIRERHDRQWIVWNAHYWMEQSQRGWLCDFGAPGSCTLPTGRHDDFAEQICREVLIDKAELGGKMAYKWDHLPGPHDYADCMAMLYMMAACMAGIGTGGVIARPQKRIERRKARVPLEA